MSRQKKIDEELWEDAGEDLISDHVVERFFAQHETDSTDARRHHPPNRPRRRGAPRADSED
jgi:hypothetical protein